MSTKAVVSLTTGLEDAERVTIAFLVAVGAAETDRATLAANAGLGGTIPMWEWIGDDEIVLGRWFGPDDDVRKLRSVAEVRVAGREHVLRGEVGDAAGAAEGVGRLHVGEVGDGLQGARSVARRSPL